MILDIHYHVRRPEQIQNIRRISYYPDVLVIYFKEDQETVRNIPMRIVSEFWVTND